MPTSPAKDRNTLSRLRPPSLLAALCAGSVSLFGVAAAAEEPTPSPPANAATQAGAATLQNFTELLKAEASRAETATKHESDVIEQALKREGEALTFLEYVVAAAGAVLVAVAGFVAWALTAANRATKTDIEKEVRMQLTARVAEEIEARAKSTLERIATLESNIGNAEQSLGKQRKAIRDLVHWTMGYWPYNHLRVINDMKIRGNPNDRFEFRSENAFKRELGFLIDNGYLENINLDSFQDRENMLDKLTVTDAGRHYLAFRESLAPKPLG